MSREHKDWLCPDCSADFPFCCDGEKQRAETHLAELKAELTKLGSIANTEVQENAALRTRVGDAEARVAELEAKLKRSHCQCCFDGTAKVRELTSTVALLRGKVDRHNADSLRAEARVAELEAECRDLRPAPHLLESAEQECGELRTENVRLRAALDRYGVHEDGCEAMHEPDNEPRHPRCDCGLSAELR